jgi:hypothetical protein
MSEEEPDGEEEETRILNCDGLPKQPAQQVLYNASMDMPVAEASSYEIIV